MFIALQRTIAIAQSRASGVQEAMKTTQRTCRALLLLPSQIRAEAKWLILAGCPGAEHHEGFAAWQVRALTGLLGDIMAMDISVSS